MINTALLVKIAASFSKQFIMLCGAKDTLQGDIAENLSDYFLEKTGDALAARSASRTFESLGDKAAENLAPVFQDSTMDEDSYTAVTDAVAGALTDTSIAVMIDANMDANTIVSKVLEGPAARVALFSDDERRLYERCIKACIAQLVALVAKSPEFIGAGITEVLRRQNALSSQLDGLKELVVSITANDQASPHTDDLFEERYRRAVADNLDKVDLFGIDVAQSSKRQKLSVAYTSLSSLVTARTDEGDSDEIVPVEHLVMNSPLLLIAGPPGSGKTTVLRWIAINAAQRRQIVEAEGPIDRIPFYIPLRQCGNGSFPRPEEFVRFCAPSIAGTMPDGWVHRCLETGRGLILIDGVDEIPGSLKHDARDWVDDLRRTYPGTHIFITARPHALSGPWRQDGLYIELQEMDVADVYDFIDRWHAAVEGKMAGEGEIQDLESTKRKLKAEIDKNIALRNVATTPLLCAAICALNRDRNQQVPTKRVEIYEALCAMLLERRDKERHLDVEGVDYPNLTLQQKWALVEDLAYYMLRNGWVSIGIDDVRERIGNKLPSLVNLEAAPSDVIRLLVERSGIVRDINGAEIDFTHRTLQEFLSARAIKNEGDWGKLTDHAGDDRWREVIILAMGIAPQKRADAVVGGLLLAGELDASVRYQRHLLAVACLDTAVELSPSVQQRVKDSLATLIPPAIPDDARIIATTGDLAVPYLSYNPDYSTRQACDCIRALMFIGSDAAMEAIKSYAADKRAAVLNAAINAARYFQPQEYFSRVLSFFGVRALSFPAAKSLKGLNTLANIEELALGLASPIADFSPLAALSKLKKLEINCHGIALQDYRFLSELHALESLTIDGPVDPSFLTNITALSGLQKLVVRDCRQVRDYSPLRALSNLRVLELEGCDHLADVSFLDPLGSMEQIAVRGLGGVRDLTPLSRLTRLTTLELQGIGRVWNFAFLRPLTGLRSVTLKGSRRTIDVSPIGEIRHLTRLCIDDVHGLTDTSFLSNLGALESLELACTGNEPIDLTPVQRLVGLEDLQLRGFGQQDSISFTGAMGRLKVLVLDGFDNVGDINALARLSAMKSLYLSGFKGLSDITPLQSLTQLRVTVLIQSPEAAGLPDNTDGWGRPVRGGLRVIDTAVARRKGLQVYSLKFALLRGPFTGLAKIIEGRS